VVGIGAIAQLSHAYLAPFGHVRQQHERIALTRNGEPEAVLLSVDDLEGLEMTLEILGDAEKVSRITESPAALERGEPGADTATVRCRQARSRPS
jgi:antitoxin YefM